MIGFALPFLSYLGASMGGAESVAVPDPQEAAAQVQQCGLGRVSVDYDEESQEDILTANANDVTDAQLACADRVVGFAYTLRLPPAAQQRFDALQNARADALVHDQARKWLSEHGLLDRLPHYTLGQSNDVDFAREIEALCGPRAKGALSSEYGPHSLSPAWAASKNPDDMADTLGCIMYSSWAAGFQIGFIGNEAVAPPR